MPTPHAEVFKRHRRSLFGAAYRVLGTVADSEDAVQEAWLRWQHVDPADVREPRAYLLRTVTRVALNIVRASDRRREEYIGPWLPEPVSTSPGAPVIPDDVVSPSLAEDPGHAAEIAGEVSLALLVVLESLSPLERAAFVLREVFAVPYPEIAETLERGEPAVRQLVRRARAHVRARAPRHPVDAQTHRRLTTAFLGAAQGEVPLESMIALLSPEVVLTTDGGGIVKAARRPVHGPDNVLRFLAGVLAKPEVAQLAWQIAEVNGGSVLVGHEGARVDCVAWFEADGGRITRIDMIRNPEKLGAVHVGAAGGRT